jgi:hypothetical protein
VNYIRIKNWKNHQHYTGRNPPWIKLHNSLFDDYEFCQLDNDSKLCLVLLWLLASRATKFHADGDPMLPDDEQHLAGKIGMGKKLPLKTLKSLGFLIMSQDASNLQAKCSSERERETERETYKEETEKKAFMLPPSIRPEVWKSFEEHRKKKRAPMTDRARQLTVDACANIGGDPNELLEQSILRGWTSVFPIKVQLVGISEQVPTKKKRVVTQQNCHCGKPATTRIGDDYECDECITKGQ